MQKSLLFFCLLCSWSVPLHKTGYHWFWSLQGFMLFFIRNFRIKLLPHLNFLHFLRILTHLICISMHDLFCITVLWSIFVKHSYKTGCIASMMWEWHSLSQLILAVWYMISKIMALYFWTSTFRSEVISSRRSEGVSCMFEFGLKSWLQALSGLHEQIPSFPKFVALKIIEEELGSPIGKFFSDISDQPVAAASFGQVVHLLMQCLFQVLFGCYNWREAFSFLIFWHLYVFIWIDFHFRSIELAPLMVLMLQWKYSVLTYVMWLFEIFTFFVLGLVLNFFRGINFLALEDYCLNWFIRNCFS